MTVLERLRQKANSLPQTPGVYIMKNAEGRVIYVGKSKKLKNRVTSYFAKNHISPKTARLVSLIRDLDYIVCKTEIEALTLENVLIKKHSPKYNVKLKDAKSYPYIKITRGEFPRLVVTRDRKSDGGRYFGPYSGTSVAYSALDVITKTFAIPTCKRSFPEDIGRERPCIYRDMGRCIAPCTGKVSAEEYAYLIKCAEKVLSGEIKETVSELTEAMAAHAEAEEFEKAAAIRDRIFALKSLSEKQKVVADEKINRDVFSIFASPTEAVMATLSVRGGALVSKNEFMLEGNEPTVSDCISLIADYYEGGGAIPKEIYLDFEADEEDTALLSEYLSILNSRRVEVKVPERGGGKALCLMARANAEEMARQFRLEGQREDKSLNRLSVLLGLDKPPKRIEAYDISNIGDECIRASMVVYADGKLKRSDYRSFKITTTDGRDDYGSMKEVLTRRLSHIGDGTQSLGESPELILLDGGDAHVGIGLEVLRTLGLDIPLFGMVKDDFHKTRAITDGTKEISIATEMSVYTFIYNLQEEAHRFAIKQSSGAKTKSLRHSALEKIKGVGPAKARLLLSKMKLAEIKTATVEQLTAIKGISESDAKAIFDYYHKES